MNYTDEQLDNMTLTERVQLAKRGEITWDKVNRPQADAIRYEREEMAKPVYQRLANTPLVRDSRTLRDRRHARMWKERNRRIAFNELMQENGVDMHQTVTLPEMPTTVALAV